MEIKRRFGLIEKEKLQLVDNLSRKDRREILKSIVIYHHNEILGLYGNYDGYYGFIRSKICGAYPKELFDKEDSDVDEKSTYYSKIDLAPDEYITSIKGSGNNLEKSTNYPFEATSLTIETNLRNLGTFGVEGQYKFELPDVDGVNRYHFIPEILDPMETRKLDAPRDNGLTCEVLFSIRCTRTFDGQVELRAVYDVSRPIFSHYKHYVMCDEFGLRAKINFAPSPYEHITSFKGSCGNIDESIFDDGCKSRRGVEFYGVTSLTIETTHRILGPYGEEGDYKFEYPALGQIVNVLTEKGRYIQELTSSSPNISPLVKVNNHKSVQGEFVTTDNAIVSTGRDNGAHMYTTSAQGEFVTITNNAVVSTGRDSGAQVYTTSGQGEFVTTTNNAIVSTGRDSGAYVYTTSAQGEFVTTTNNAIVSTGRDSGAHMYTTSAQGKFVTTKNIIVVSTGNDSGAHVYTRNAQGEFQTTTNNTGATIGNRHHYKKIIL